MIELKNLNKYYNKGKSNELHVLKDISLEFGNSGLVALYGKSGSGKSTLLNCIGGNIGFETGLYCVDDAVLSDGKTNPIVNYKSKNIGFVFQDYNLIETESVEQNILLALQIAKMSLSREKVNIVLSAVKMAKYNKRKINTLSGGQKQRIAIARALVTNPSVILADEPTGNLDAQNSLQILKLLKAISKETLVILVSHERGLVNTFADRIIEIENATIISDTLNNATQILNADNKENQAGIKSANEIKSIQRYSKSVLSSDKLNITLYYDDEKNLTNFTFIVKGKTISLYNKEYEINKIDTKEFISTIQHDSFIENDEINQGNKSLNDSSDLEVSVRDNLRDTANANCKKNYAKEFIRLFSTGKINKMIAIVLVVASILIAFSSSFLNGATKINYAKFQTSSSNMMSISVTPTESSSKYNVFNNDNYVVAVLPYNAPKQFNFTQTGILQANLESLETIYFELSPLPISLINENDIIYGRMPENNFEVILDEFYVDKLFAEHDGFTSRATIFGIVSSKGFIGGELLIYSNQSVKIVGISNTNEPTIYMHNDLLNSIYLQQLTSISNTIFTEQIAYFTDTNITFNNENEIYVSQSEYIKSGYTSGGYNRITLANKEYTIKDFYVPNKSGDFDDSIIMSSQELYNLTWDALSTQMNIDVVVKDKNQAKIYFANHGYYAIDLLQNEVERYKDKVRSEMTLQLIFTIAIALSATILCYFCIKSSLITQKQELFVRVSLGTPIKKIYYRFILFAILTTLLFAIPSYLLTQFLLKIAISKIAGLQSMMSITLQNTILGLVGLIFMPIIVTIIAVSRQAIWKNV